MNIFWFVIAVSATGYRFSSYTAFVYNRNRSFPLPIINELDTTISENPDIQWENGEVPWEIEDLKNITLQPMKKRPTSVSSFRDYCLFHTLIDL
jgi:hypothetical protein